MVCQVGFVVVGSELGGYLLFLGEGVGSLPEIAWTL